MDVAFYHDDPSNRIATAAYDPQSSPGSVESFSSTDAGPVRAIAKAPFERFGQDFSKSAVLKGMNLQVQSGNISYTSAQQLNFAVESGPITVSSDSFAPLSNSYEVTTTSNIELNISDAFVTSATNNSTPEALNMLKVGAPDFDNMLTQYSQAAPQIQQHAYSRSLMQEQEMYVQNYARELARQRTHGGSNPDLAASNQVATPSPSGLISGSSSGPSHQFEPSDPYFNSRHPDGPSTSAFGAPASTVHYINNPQPTHPLLMPHHSLNQIKDEIPQTVPVLPKQSISPIDMEEQEIIKTERKRMRNRLAASKCRKRKLERISRLEEKVNNLKQQNLELSTNANVLRQQVAELKSKVMSHVNSGCQIMMSQPQVTF